MKLRFPFLLLACACSHCLAAEPPAGAELSGGSPELMSSSSPAAALQAPASTDEPPEEIAARVKVWQEMRLGMFIHWGVYSQLAGHWDGKPVGGNGEWIQYNANIPNDAYAKAAARFHPTRFDAKAWARAAKDAGMRYVVITAKHHDGFCLYPSEHTEFTLQKVTPFKRDPIKELELACREQGLAFGLYFSNDLDWHSGMWNNDDGEDLKKTGKHAELVPGRSMGPNLGKNPAAFDHYYRTVAMPQVTELLTRYGPLVSLFFDGKPRAATVEQGLEMRALVRRLQPEVVINNRIRSVRGDYFSYEQRLPQLTDPQIWEGCMTMNSTWGFKSQDDRWKPTPQLLFTMVDAISKGGNFLLNVGPTGEGIIPENCVAQLRETGDWLKVNGEAVYGTQRSPFGREFGFTDPAKKDTKGKPVFVVTKDWRCTTKPRTLYIHLFKWPDGKFVLPGLKTRPLKAALLSDPGKDLPLEWDGGNAIIALPDQAPHPIASVLRLTLEGKP